MLRHRLYLAIALLLLLSTAVWAQDYSFAVPEMEMHVQTQDDASATIEYRILFYCNEGAHPIDIVDINVPSAAYDISEMRATLDGVAQTNIRPSEYVDSGVEVHLTSPIQPAQSGTFEMTFTMPDLVWQDATNPQYMSLQITPTWFDGAYMTGSTNLAISIYITGGIDPEEVLDLNAPFSGKFQLDNGTVAVSWFYQDTTLNAPHKVGVSFPKHDTARVIPMTKFGLLMKWWKEASDVRLICGIVYLVLFGIFFFRTSGGTGKYLFVLVITTLIGWWNVSPIAHFFFPLLLVVVWLLVDRLIMSKRHKYLPPIESVPGGGIKRGLAVPEAAVILEEPLGRMLSLTIFDMLNKKQLELVTTEPLTVRVVPGYEAERAGRRRVARDRGTCIRGYEQGIIEAILERPGVPVKDLDLRNVLKYMIENVATRMKGFDFDATKKYYRSVAKRAWTEAKQIDEVEERGRYVDNNLLWLMMAPDYKKQFTGWHSRGYHYRPSWQYAGDSAASFAAWAENITDNLANSLGPVRIDTQSGNIINLTGVDTICIALLAVAAACYTSISENRPIERPFEERYTRHEYTDCACACAGCVCACACAGGGR